MEIQTRAAGDATADFCLTDASGAPYDSRAARSDGLLLFVIYKVSCGTCACAFPFLQRFQKQYAGAGFRIWGVSQDDADATAAFAARHGATFPQALDTSLDVTTDYGLVTVPGIYLVDGTDQILRQSAGFVSEDLNDLARLAAERTGKAYLPVVRTSDHAPALKPG